MISSHTYHPPQLIDTAPLAARYAFMIQAILAFIAAGHMGLVLRYSEKLLRVLRVHNRLTGANVLVRRKRDMLFNSAWRRRVLWGLGGREKLRRWDEFNARFMPKLEIKSAGSLNGYGPVKKIPAWLNTPERIAESERLKAHARNIMRATINPNVTRDRIKTDFDGLFRLPPLPRQERLSANTKIYTQNTIGEYIWNPIPFAKVEGFGPAMVWPREFYAAMIADGEMLEEELPLYNEVAQYNSVTPRRGLSQSKIQKARDDKHKNLSIIPLRDALKPSTYRALFEDPI